MPARTPEAEKLLSDFDIVVRQLLNKTKTPQDIKKEYNLADTAIYRYIDSLRQLWNQKYPDQPIGSRDELLYCPKKPYIRTVPHKAEPKAKSNKEVKKAKAKPYLIPRQAVNQEAELKQQEEEIQTNNIPQLVEETSSQQTEIAKDKFSVLVARCEEYISQISTIKDQIEKLLTCFKEEM